MNNREMPKPQVNPGAMPTPVQPPAPVQAEAPVQPPVQAEVPVEEPKVELGPKGSDSIVPVKKINNGIMVTATKKGFYNNLRKRPGDRFMISSAKKWGSWMDCDDPALQKKLEAEYKIKVRHAREL